MPYRSYSRRSVRRETSTLKSYGIRPLYSWWQLNKILRKLIKTSGDRGEQAVRPKSNQQWLRVVYCQNSEIYSLLQSFCLSSMCLYYEGKQPNCFVKYCDRKYAVKRYRKIFPQLPVSSGYDDLPPTWLKHNVS